MTTVRERGAKPVEEAAVCGHHWVIDSPNGPVSQGVCKRCGAVKEFHNSVPGYTGVWARAQTLQRKANDKAYKPRDGGDDEPDDIPMDTVLETDTDE